MTRLILGLAMVLAAVPAWGFTDNPRAASADYILSGALRVNNPPIGDVIRCPTGVCQFMLHRTVPTESTTTGAIAITIRRYSPDVSPSGAMADQVCLAVVRPGHNADNITTYLVLSCSLFSNITASNVLLVTNLLSVVPLDDAGNPCTASTGGNSCAGGELYILIQKNPGGSSNNLDYTSLTLTYQ